MTVKATDTDNMITRFKWGFADAFANTVDPSFADVKRTGAGMTINQTGGNLVIGAGTTAYAETLIRVREPILFEGILRYGLTLSQRIVDNNFAIELVDVIGDLLPITVINATTVNVFKENHNFTSKDIGKSMWIGAITVANCPSVFATIASITDVNTFVLTVAGFTAGSGTCSLFGMNHYQVIYNGTGASGLGSGMTTARKGYRNAQTNVSINSTASPGHIGIIEAARHSDAGFADGINSVATNGAIKYTTRVAFDQNIPDVAPLYIQIRVFNNAVAPVSNTTMTLAFIDMQLFNVQAVQIAGIDNFAKRSTIPVELVTDLAGGTPKSVIGPNTATHSTTSSGAPVRIGGRVNTAADITLIQGDVSDLFMTSAGQAVTKPFGTAELDWQYAAVTGGIINTTDVIVKAAAGASVRNYVTALQYRNTNAVATELVIKDGTTVIWRVLAPANMASSEDVVFITPLKGTANTAVNVACITTGAAVYINLQGYSSF